MLPTNTSVNAMLCRSVLASLMLLLTACASMPTPVSRQPSRAIAATAQTELGALVLQTLAEHGTPTTAALATLTARSGLRPMPEANVALDARLTLMRRAQSSLDLQYYLVGNDEIGHLLLRELRDAAQRGVRVRLLVDDFYTLGTDRLLMGLASHPNIEVRLFNPFAYGRDTSVGRWLNLATDFNRLNHRMHNKLFLADGAIAIAGGRNMADGYFLRGSDNFIDFDALAIGPVVSQFQTIFDSYWNSPHVYPIVEVAPTSETADSLRDYFHSTVDTPDTDPGAQPTSPLASANHSAKDAYGVPLLSVDLPSSLQQLVWGETAVFADSPEKVLRGTTPAEMSETALYHVLAAFREARSELLLFSPYFVPGAVGMKGLAEARSHGIPVRVITNSMATTDEPLASLAYERYRIPMLKMGVDLYELRPLQGTADDTGRTGASRSRWHAKMAFVDRKTMILGSLNMDQRSATTNTEIVVSIHSAEFAARVLQYFHAARAQEVDHVNQVTLKPDGHSLQWVALRGKGGYEVLEVEPDMDYLLRLKLMLLSPFVSEDLL